MPNVARECSLIGIPQDDLAEHVIASPIPYDGDADWEDTSRFENYWDDLNYNGDGYDDYEVKKKRTRVVKTPSKGRKRKLAASEESPRKRLKSKSGTASAKALIDMTPLLWMSISEREAEFHSKYEVKGEFGKAISLIPDWRDRYKGVTGFPKGGRSLKLEEVVDDDEDPFSTGAKGKGIHLSEGLVEDEDLAREELETLHIDPEALKRALKEQLSAAGLKVNGVDEQTLLQLAERMFAGGEDDGEDIVGELANDLLGREEDENEGGGLASWVSKQVDLAQADEPEHESKETVSHDAHEKNVEGSAPTRRTVLHQQLDPAEHSEEAVVPWPPPAPSSSKISPGKRKAEKVDDGLEGSAPLPKRRAPSYAAPTAASKAKKTASSTANGTQKGRGK